MAAVITPARNDGVDAEAIAAIDHACFAQSTVNIDAELERSWSHVWVARASDERSEPRAFLLAWLVADELHVLSVATLPGFRRQGLARALLEHAIAFAHERKVRSILLEVRRSNRSAIRLYRGFGFSALGIRPRYYADNWEDAIEMALALDPRTGDVVLGRDEVEI
ncbi:MAG TPA: ribosomal protein S18-alanine N-acetyltransferase [Polyangiaceae bacterium]